MKQIRERVAGLDVHRDTVVACCRVPGIRRDFKTVKRSFHTTSKELAELASEPVKRFETRSVQLI
jgi:hypothetical protein